MVLPNGLFCSSVWEGSQAVTKHPTDVFCQQALGAPRATAHLSWVWYLWEHSFLPEVFPNEILNISSVPNDIEILKIRNTQKTKSLRMWIKKKIPPGTWKRKWDYFEAKLINLYRKICDVLALRELTVVKAFIQKYNQDVFL